MTSPKPISYKDWQTSHTKDDAHQDSQTRSGMLILPIILAIFLTITFSIEKSIRIVLGWEADASQLGPILRMAFLFLATLGIFIVAILLAFRFGRQFMAQFYAIPENINPSQVLRYRLFGKPFMPPPLSLFIKFSTIIFKDGKAEKSDEWPVWTATNLGGPFSLSVSDGSALYLESGEQFARVVGPGARQPFLPLHETIKAIVDLRPKEGIEKIQAWSRDGIQLTATIKMTCRIGDPGKIDPDDQLVFPYDPLAVKMAVENYAVFASRKNEQERLAGWSDLAWEETKNVLFQAIGSRQLNDLLLAGGDKGQLFSESTLESIRNEINQKTQQFGIFITYLNILELELPNEVKQQRIRNWEAERESIDTILDGKSRAREIRTREKARAEAQRDLILAIADGLERNKSRQFSEPLLLSLSGMLDTTLKNPLTRASLAKDTLETLEKLQKMLDKQA